MINSQFNCWYIKYNIIKHSRLLINQINLFSDYNNIFLIIVTVIIVIIRLWNFNLVFVLFINLVFKYFNNIVTILRSMTLLIADMIISILIWTFNIAVIIIITWCIVRSATFTDYRFISFIIIIITIFTVFIVFTVFTVLNLINYISYRYIALLYSTLFIL